MLSNIIVSLLKKADDSSVVFSKGRPFFQIMFNYQGHASIIIYFPSDYVESTSSLLNLNLPHLEHVHPENSKIYLITPSEFSYFQRQQELSDSMLQQSSSAHTSRENKENKNVEEIYLKISSDVALFSKSNCSSSSCMYDYSDEDLPKGDVSEAHSSKVFEACKIHNRPLVSVRSMAHSNKLSANCNNIYVSLLDSDSKSSSEYICRICHGGESMDDLLTPCRCRGTIALVHLKCLERWLKESNHSQCELCQHHYKIIREPRYGVVRSILVFLRHPGPHLKDILLDLLSFAVYTPSAVASTYMLMMICESLVKSNIVTTGTFSSHIIAFSAVFGMAAIDFTYSSWLMLTFQRHYEAWRDWYRSHSTLKVVLPNIKLRPHKKRLKPKNN